ncbi:MAG: prolipoprotein diacylglyceryl transferase [Phycisphaerales bacterium]|nr:MAG: prolipoprotein diacylglyceryl transferase [Phycisphaerales bacterium]
MMPTLPFDTPTVLAAWLHDWNPVLLPISGDFAVRWYGLSYVAGFAVGYFLLRFMSRRGMTPIPGDRAFDVIIIAAITGVVGGRLGYVAFYQPSLLWSFDSGFPWWSVLALNQGGMASHGGIMGVFIGAWLVSRGFRAEVAPGRIERVGRSRLLHVCDVFAAIAPPGLLFGRLANFVNGELLGRVVAPPGEAAPWWAVRFPQEHLTKHAPALSESQEDELTRLVRDVAPGANSFETGYQRVLELLQSGHADVAARLEPLVSARHPSQLYQALCEGLIVGLVVWLVWRRPRTPGVVGAWFLISYGLLRIATEFVRLPDAHLVVTRFAGLSRGQWLSGMMVLAGVAMLVWVRRRGGEKLGGWGRATAQE